MEDVNGSARCSFGGDDLAFVMIDEVELLMDETEDRAVHELMDHQ
jgi:hypothetical protein